MNFIQKSKRLNYDDDVTTDFQIKQAKEFVNYKLCTRAMSAPGGRTALPPIRSAYVYAVHTVCTHAASASVRKHEPGYYYTVINAVELRVGRVVQ